MTSVILPDSDLAAAIAWCALDGGLLDPDVAFDLLASGHDNDALVTHLLRKVAHADVLRVLGDLVPGVEFADLASPGLRYRSDVLLTEQCDLARLVAISALPLRDPATDEVVVVAANPMDPSTVDYFRSVFGTGSFRLILGLRNQIQDALALAGDPTADVSQLAEDPRAILAWTDQMLARAAAERTSDIHVQYDRSGRLRIRFRIDGTLQRGATAPLGRESEVVGSLMSRAGMDVSNTILPQDGTFSFSAAGRTIDTRASMLPQDNGPSMVLRLLDSQSTRLRMEDLGASPEVIEVLRRCLNSSQGTIVTSGPTGSGKTTTMYALLREVDAEKGNVVTIEDPIEYRLSDIGQTQVRPGLGERSLTFAKALRAILRHDPDVILVGEIRDPETAATAMEAAITGHLVLSTIHASSALSVMARFNQMGVPRYMVAEAVSAVASQRLMRRLHACAVEDTLTDEEKAMVASWGLTPPERIRRRTGCEVCRQTGVMGRILTMEVIEPDAEYRQAIIDNVPQAQLEKMARRLGYVPLLEDAMRHVARGTVALEEVLRTVTPEVRRDK